MSLFFHHLVQLKKLTTAKLFCENKKNKKDPVLRFYLQ